MIHDYGVGDKSVFILIDIDEINELKMQLSSSNINTELLIYLELPAYNAAEISELKDLTNFLSDYTKITYAFSEYSISLKVSDLKNLINLESSVLSENIKFKLVGGINDYSLTEVLHAQKQIDEFAHQMEKSPATPLEKYLMIYNFLIKRVYKEDATNPGISRDLVGVLNSNNIVCVGYAHIMKKLCDIAGIECYEQPCVIYDKQTGDKVGGHMNNLVKIKDDKYGIDGLFYCDACWDAKAIDKNSTYNYCLLPLKYVKDFKNSGMMFCPGTEFLYNNKQSVSCYYDIEGLEEFGILTKIDDSPAMIDVLDKEKINRSCNRVKSLFLKHNIPADIYLHKRVPRLCSLSRFVALFFEDNIDTSRTNEAIEELLKLKNQGELYNNEDLILNHTDKQIENVYELLDKIKEQHIIQKTDLNECLKTTEKPCNNFLATQFDIFELFYF